MSVVKEGLVFVSEKYKKSLPQTGPDGEKLLLGENAFVTLQDAIDGSYNNPIVFLDKKLEIKKSVSADIWTTYDYDSTDANWDLKSANTLVLSGADASKSVFRFFKDVTVSNKAVAGILSGGNNTMTEKGGVVTENLSAAGKLTVKNAQVNTSYGMDTVSVEKVGQAGSAVGNFYRGLVDSSGTSVFSGTGKITVKDNSLTTDLTAKKGGKFTAEDSYLLSAVGYNTVILEESSIEQLANDITTKVTEKYTDEILVSHLIQGAASGSLTLKDDSFAKTVEGYLNVTLDDSSADSLLAYGSWDILAKEEYNNKFSIDSKGNAKGSISCVLTGKSAGTAKLTDESRAGVIGDYTTVSLTEGSSAGELSRKQDSTENTSVSFKTAKDGSVTAASSLTKNVTQNGSVTVNAGFVGKMTTNEEGEKVFEGGAVTNFAAVKLVNASAGDICWNTENLFKYTLKNTMDFDSASDVVTDELAYYIDDTAEDRTETRESKAAGSVTVTLDKKSDAKVDYVVGNISGYNAVTITGYNDKKGVIRTVSAGSISALEGEYSYGYSKYDYKNGTETSTWKAAGAAKITDASVESIRGFGTVALTRANVSGSVVNGLTATLKGDTFTRTQSGSFAAVDSSVVGDVTFFKTVKLTNSSAGEISSLIEDEKNALAATAALTDSRAGSIIGYKTVTLTGSNVANIDGAGFKGTAVNLSSSAVTGESGIVGVQTVNIKKGRNYLSGFAGTELADKITINKGTSLEVSTLTNESEGKDTLVINGTLVLVGDADFSGFVLSGKGEIAASSGFFGGEAIEGFAGKCWELGETAQNFAGTAAEKADDTAKKAVVWNADSIEDSFTGWLGSWTEVGKESPAGSDTVDFVKLTVAEDCTVSASDDIVIGGIKEGEILKAGTVYTLEIKLAETAESSVFYTIGFASAEETI